MQVFCASFCEAIRECLQQYRAVIVVPALEPRNAIIDTQTRRNGEATEIVVYL